MSLPKEFSGRREDLNGRNGVAKSKLSTGFMLCCCRSGAKMCLLQEWAITCLLQERDCCCKSEAEICLLQE